MGLLRMAARTAVVAGTATAVSGRVARRQEGRWAAQDAQQQAEYEAQQAQYAAQAAPAEPAEPDYMEELAQLAKMRDAGILTADEFEAKKKQILGI